MNTSMARAVYDQNGALIGIAGETDGEVLAAGKMNPYLGQVASRCRISTKFEPSNKQLMARSKHIALDQIDSMAVVFANWYVKENIGETNVGSSTTYKCAIEYPAGTIAAVVTWNGSDAGFAQDGETLISDMMKVSIPLGAAFFVRTWLNSAAGIPYHQGGSLNPSAGINDSGESFYFDVATTDLTKTAGNFNNRTANLTYRPAALLGWTTKPSLLLAGDSRQGNGNTLDLPSDGYGLSGEFEKAMGRYFATINMGCSGERVQSVASGGYEKRVKFADWVSHVAIGYGINDIAGFNGATRTAAQVQSDVSTMATQFAGKPVYIATLSPYSSSSDGWATTANQTTNATNAQRIAFNDWVRKMPAPFSGYLEVADQTESARNSGLWKAGLTADGLHGNANATSAIAESGKVAINALMV